MSIWAVYIRRSYCRIDAAAVSDETQEAMCRAALPAGATVEVIRDSGGHRSGATTAPTPTTTPRPACSPP